MKKAQAAMEFLMTYGFAILAVITGMAAISYFGLVNNKAEPSKCMFPAGMDCIDHPVITVSNLTVALRNNLGNDLTITNVTANACTPTMEEIAVGPGNNYGSFPTNVSLGDVFKVRITCNHNKGTRISESIEISYINQDTGLPHVVKGDITGYAA